MQGRWAALAPAELLAATIASWVADPDSDVVYAEPVEDRWAVRMTQTVREATTVWWWVGERSTIAEAYAFPTPASADSYRLCLKRNLDTWWSKFAMDRDGDIVIRARLLNETVTAKLLDAVLGEIYELVEITFPALVERETSA